MLFISVGVFFRLKYQQYESKEKYIYNSSGSSQNIENIVTDDTKPSQLLRQALVIPRINKKLRIDPITIDETKDAKEWPISTIGVNLVNSEAVLGISGNSIIYGHNWKSIFGDLKKLQEGDQIVVYNGNSEKLVYRVNKVNVVDTKQVSLLSNHGANELTLYTCIGILDSKRLVVTSSFVANLGASI